MRPAPQKQKSDSKSPKKLPQDFKSVTRRLECDENKEAFERKLGKIAKAKPPTGK